MIHWVRKERGNAVARDWSRGKLGYWVIGVEASSSGRLHGHMLVSGAGVENFHRQTGWRLWHEKYGMARIEKVLDTANCCRYVSKYVCGEASDLVVGNLPSSAPLGYRTFAGIPAGTDHARRPGAPILDAPGL